MRSQSRADLLKQADFLKARAVHVIYNFLLCFADIAMMFFFNFFDRIDQTPSNQPTSAPWSALLGLFVSALPSR